MFGQLLEKLDIWVGRSFLIVTFFPLLIFLGANAVMVHILAPDAEKYAISYVSTFNFGPFGAFATGLATVAVVAYVTEPLVGTMNRFLEGAYFPSCIAGLLATDQANRLRSLEQDLQASGQHRIDLHLYRAKLDAELRPARDKGVAVGAMRNSQLIEEAADKIKNLRRKQDWQQPIVPGDFDAVWPALIEALANNCAEERSLAEGASASDRANSRKLDDIFRSVVRLLDYAHRKATSDYSDAVDRKDMSFATHELPATNFGNRVAAQRGFFRYRFNLDFAFFWPIMQILLQGDQKTMDGLLGARQKVDFCIRILLYTIVFVVFWLIVATWVTERPLALPLIGTLGLFAAAVSLEAIHVNYRGFSDLVRGIVILKRFELLKALHYRLPDSWDDEKALWDMVTTQLRWGSQDGKVVYQHPDK